MGSLNMRIPYRQPLILLGALGFWAALAAVLPIDNSARAVEFRTEEIVVISVRGRFRLDVEIAETEAQRALGLQYRQH
ncbi:MAG: DUF192 domain-containing protein, partial [Rhodospirillales bacterium]|nr:DUF192 domain-containing protein [Rhodospirillales bacterium]